MKKIVLFLSVALLWGAVAAQNRDLVNLKLQQDEKLVQLAQETLISMEADKAEAIQMATQKNWAPEAETEDYPTRGVTATNVWTGAFNYYWHNAGNWSLGHIPTATEDVIMTSAGYHPPSVASSYDEACRDLKIGRAHV